LHSIALDLHPSATTVAELPARQIAIDRLALNHQARGQSFHDAGEAGTVRFAGRNQT
jgi:hypothetical protein